MEKVTHRSKHGRQIMALQLCQFVQKKLAFSSTLPQRPHTPDGTSPRFSIVSTPMVVYFVHGFDDAKKRGASEKKKGQEAFMGA